MILIRYLGMAWMIKFFIQFEILRSEMVSASLSCLKLSNAFLQGGMRSGLVTYGQSALLENGNFLTVTGPHFTVTCGLDRFIKTKS